jgi:hypothetical protein
VGRVSVLGSKETINIERLQAAIANSGASTFIDK